MPQTLLESPSSPGGPTELLLIRQSPDAMPPPPRRLPWTFSRVYADLHPDPPAPVSWDRTGTGGLGGCGSWAKFLTPPRDRCEAEPSFAFWGPLRLPLGLKAERGLPAQPPLPTSLHLHESNTPRATLAAPRPGPRETSEQLQKSGDGACGHRCAEHRPAGTWRGHRAGRIPASHACSRPAAPTSGRRKADVRGARSPTDQAAPWPADPPALPIQTTENPPCTLATSL